MVFFDGLTEADVVVGVPGLDELSAVVRRGPEVWVLLAAMISLGASGSG
jgi:hypothetical protein